VGEGFEGGGVGEVVDEKEGVGGEVGTGPEGAVFFLASGIGQGEVVRETVYGAGDGVGVFDRGVVSVGVISEYGKLVKSLRLTHESTVIGRDGGLSRICLVAKKELVLACDSSKLQQFACFSLLLRSNIPHPPSPQMVIEILSAMTPLACALHCRETVYCSRVPHSTRELEMSFFMQGRRCSTALEKEVCYRFQESYEVLAGRS
jgi:hypothetical protein